MTKVAVVLSGCGHMDGAEIRESVLTLLSLDQLGAQVEIFAPDIEQSGVVDHFTGQAVGEKRNVLAEAARIARGQIKPLSAARAENFDALAMPGGYGAAKNLSDFAAKGAGAAVLPELETLIQAFHAAQKPVAAVCIAPAVLAAALKKAAPKVTIGEDAGTASAIEALGGQHQNCPTDDCVVDARNLLVTTPAYMRDARLSDVAKGIDKAMRELIKMAKKQANQAA